MKPILFTLVATACYSVCNVLLELKFAKLNALTLMIVYASVIWISAFGMRQLVKTDDPSFNFPTGTFLILAIVLGLIYAMGDWFFVSAYNHGGDVITITCITVLIPVVASLLKFGFKAPKELVLFSRNLLYLNGFAAALAPDLALAGFGAQEGAIEEALGQLVGSGFEVAHLVDELGSRWEIMRNYFRLYACCNPIHSALDCLSEALAELRPSPDQIESIDIATYRFASVMRNPDPPNYFASKYSLPHAAAVMVVRGNAGFKELDDGALQDPAIAALRQRVHVTEDPAMSAVAPRLRPARVSVTLTDGRQATRAGDSYRGDFQRPFAESEIREKFHELAGVVMTPEGVSRVEDAVDRCEVWESVDELTELLRRHERP